MKPIYTLILLLFSFSAFSQKIHFSDKRNHWHTFGYNGAPCYFTGEGHYDSDTVINGTVYQSFISYKAYLPSPLGCFGTYAEYPMYIREDTIANIVYALTPVPLHDSVEHILYNFGLQVGDTQSHYEGTYRITDSVFQIDSTIINGVYHKVFLFTRASDTTPHSWSPYSLSYTLVEGIGSLTNFNYPFGYCFEYENDLTCFAQDTVAMPFTLDTMVKCDRIYTNTAYNCSKLAVDNCSPTHFPSISPNPADGIVNINLPDKHNSDMEIVVYNMLGKIVFNSHLDAGKDNTSINIGQWANGIYMIIFRDNENVFAKEKLIVSH